MHLQNLINRLLPKTLWTRRFTLMWVAATFTFLYFDIVWSAMTTFRGMSFFATYVYAVLGGLIFAMPSVIAPKRIWIQTIALLLLDLLLSANLMYFRTYFTAIPASSYLFAANLADFKGSVIDAVGIQELGFYAITIVATVLAYRLPQSNVRKSAYIVTLGVWCVVSMLCTLPHGGLRAHCSDLSRQCYYATCPPVIYTVFGSVYADAMKSAEPLTQEDRDFVMRWLEQNDSVHAEYPLQTRMPRSSVFVVFLESFESWPIGLKLEEKEITPFINSLIADTSTMYVPHVQSQVGAGRSIDAQLLMLAGIYPMQSDVYAMNHSDSRYRTVQHAFKAAHPEGRTYLLTPDKPGVWNQVHVADAFGVDTLISYSSWTQDELFGHPARLSDKSLMRQTIEKMETGEVWPVGSTAFVHLITYSGHNPFVVPKEMQCITLLDDYPANLKDYLTDINYVDNQLKTLIEYLKSRPDYHDTMIVIVGDHEGLGTNRRTFESDRRAAFVPKAPEAFVPLIILNSPVPGRIDDVMGQVDIYCTLLDLLNLRQHTSWPGMGHSILSPAHPRAAISSSGELVGRPTSQFDDMITARRASDLIIKHNLLP